VRVGFNGEVLVVRSPAEPGELAELAGLAGLAGLADGPVLACLVFEDCTGHVRGFSATGEWQAWLNPVAAARLRASRAVDEEIGGSLYRPAAVLATPRESSAYQGFLALLGALGIGAQAAGATQGGRARTVRPHGIRPRSNSALP
jgi:hypothetical protein